MPTEVYKGECKECKKFKPYCVKFNNDMVCFRCAGFKSRTFESVKTREDRTRYIN